MSDPFQTAVVTGASRGFGRAIAAALVATDTGVVGIARGERDTFVEGLQPILSPEQVAKAITELAADPSSAPEYLISGAGLRPVS
jgi:NAD(P)-dependent dehydrogenase (short-subunit alcohol dehydrogenase family)